MYSSLHKQQKFNMDSREQYHQCGLWSGSFTLYTLTYLHTKQKQNKYLMAIETRLTWHLWRIK